MITLKEAKQHLLAEIRKLAESYTGIESCEPGIQYKAYGIIMDFYDHISELHVSNVVFSWYKKNKDNVRIEYKDEEVGINKINREDNAGEFSGTSAYSPDALDDLIDQAHENAN